jgi:hypothetical protein
VKILKTREGRSVVVDNVGYECLKDKQLVYAGGFGHVYADNVRATELLGYRDCGYANFCPFDLRADNLVSGQDPLLSCIRVEPNGVGFDITLTHRVAEPMRFPSADMLSLNIMKAILERAMATANFPAVLSIRGDGIEQ